MALGKNAKIELLKRVPLFAGCSKAELRELALIADELDLRDGHVLTREGKPGREFFVLIEGTVRVSEGDEKIADLRRRRLVRRDRAAHAHASHRHRHRDVTGARSRVTDRAFRRVVETMPRIALKVLERASASGSRDDAAARTLRTTRS